ncbi:MAG TPA: hypothetical protein VHW96_19155 [Solirubrobacteraceae bacterium]|jgi:hypothetical protein|nr:hypothetical protein [Solirubrobacteraceae bacterium]
MTELEAWRPRFERGELRPSMPGRPSLMGEERGPRPVTGWPSWPGASRSPATPDGRARRLPETVTLRACRP